MSITCNVSFADTFERFLDPVQSHDDVWIARRIQHRPALDRALPACGWLTELRCQVYICQWASTPLN
jgi:hypothetical protein